MANELLDKPVEFEVNGNDVKLTGNTVAKYLTRGNGNVSEQEVVMFINLCKFQKLNPFLNEAYLIKFGNQPAQIIVSKEAFMKRGQNHILSMTVWKPVSSLERGDEMIEIEGAVKLKGDVLIGGWSKIYRKDRPVPVIVKSGFERIFSKGQATWKDMPLNMIRKTAIVNALREAFPDNVGAMYTEEEAPAVPKEAKATEEKKSFRKKSKRTPIKRLSVSLIKEHKNETHHEKKRSRLRLIQSQAKKKKSKRRFSTN